jgi:hypothetical protein
MNIIEFTCFNRKQSSTAFCLVDRTSSTASAWVSEIVKNQAEYTISNVTGKGYNLYQGLDEDALLNHVADLGYKYAVVFSTGTEFINAIDRLTKNNNFFIAGHVLDRGDAYYELHHQCFVVNLTAFNDIGRPVVGQQTLGDSHLTTKPDRSKTNYHDDYTPEWVIKGTSLYEYNHKCHGWNIIKSAFERNMKVIVFDDFIRQNKKYLYPENFVDFNKNSSWLHKRESYCANIFVHTSNTEIEHPIPDSKITQILTPASGIWWESLIKDYPITVVMYDYNKSALEYWKDNAPKHENVTYKFIELDLLGETIDIKSVLDTTKQAETFINFSNIYIYEGTCCFADTRYRMFKENELLSSIKQSMPDAYVSYNMRASGAFYTKTELHGILDKAKNIPLIETRQLKKPTWRFNTDWN